jgi:predicted NACHT family NTPase
MPETKDTVKDSLLKVVDGYLVQTLTDMLNKITIKGATLLQEKKITLGDGLKSYYESVLDKFIHIKSIAIPQKELLLDDIYIPLDIHQGDKLHSSNVQTNDAEKLFLGHDHFIIIGLAGAGKSTLTKYLFIELVKLHKTIPLLIELRILEFKDDFIDSICHYLSNLNFIISKEIMQELLLKGLFTIFFDGLDEMAIDLQVGFSRRLQEFRDKYHKNNIVIISRPSEYINSYANFEHFEINGLTEIQAIILIQKLPYYDDDVKNKFMRIIDKKLYESHKSFVQNPLLLTIMLMTYSQSADIPDKLCNFYQIAYETLFSHHDAMKGGAYHREKRTKLEMFEFEKLLSCLCFLTLQKGLISIKNKEMLDNIHEVKKFFRGSSFDDEDFKQDLIQSLSIVLQDGMYYQFVHRSFQEYFCAKFIIDHINGDDRIQNILYVFNSKMHLRTVLRLIDDIKPLYLEKYFFYQ